ncbi:MAG: putative sulfate exporter family transporter, partial [Proteobacteria bacterium]|nr:putative sulfate exporter family transporter [Pseudomonadota bacterium]
CLLPVIVFAVVCTRVSGQGGHGPRPPLLPWFAVAFAGFVAIRSAGWLPAAAVRAGSDLSGWCLVASMAAIGMKTRLRELITVGLKPVVLMVGETAFLAVLALTLIRCLS